MFWYYSLKLLKAWDSTEFAASELWCLETSLWFSGTVSAGEKWTTSF